jgi:hypothetical protein
MAVRQITAYQWLALAGDAKPTTDVIEGSRLVETDTGAEFVFDGTAWAEVSPKTR